MTRTRGLIYLLLTICLFCIFTLAGCGGEKSGNTIDEPEITTDYLAEEYAQQLTTDGAETIFGSVTMEKTEESSYDVQIIEKEVVPSSEYEEGYYIADTNVVKNVSLGSDARIVCTHDGEPIVSNADDFIAEHPGGSEYLYTVYLMGNSAELILVTEPEAVIVSTE